MTCNWLCVGVVWESPSQSCSASTLALSGLGVKGSLLETLQNTWTRSGRERQTEKCVSRKMKRNKEPKIRSISRFKIEMMKWETFFFFWGIGTLVVLSQMPFLFFSYSKPLLFLSHFVHYLYFLNTTQILKTTSWNHLFKEWLMFLSLKSYIEKSLWLHMCFWSWRWRCTALWKKAKQHSLKCIYWSFHHDIQFKISLYLKQISHFSIC